MQLPEKKYIASFDIDAQNTFTPVCPDELLCAPAVSITTSTPYSYRTHVHSYNQQ